MMVANGQCGLTPAISVMPFSSRQDAIDQTEIARQTASAVCGPDTNESATPHARCAEVATHGSEMTRPREMKATE